MGEPKFEFFDPEVDLLSPIKDPVIETTIDDNNVQGKEKGKEAVANDPNKEYSIIDIKDAGDGVVKVEDDDESAKADKTDETKDIKTSSEGGAGSSSPMPYSIYAKALADEGVLPSFTEDEYKELEDELGPAGALIELQRMAIENEVEAYKNSLSPARKQFLDALDKGVPFEELAAIKNAQLSIKGITTEQLKDPEKGEELCKSLYRQELQTRGFEDTEIDDQIKDAEQLGNLEKKGIAALNTLKKYYDQAETARITQAETDRTATEKAAKEQMDKIKTTIDKVSEIIPGTKVNQTIKKQMYESITQVVERTPDGRPLNAIWAKRLADPVNFDITLAYLLNTGAFDGKWTNVTTSARTNAVKDLEAKLKAGSIGGTGSPVITQATPKSAEILKSMSKTFKRDKQ